MADHIITMSRHYIPQSVGDCVDRIVAAATEHHDRYQQVPTLAHVPMSGDWPTTVGVVKVVRAWGLGRCEIDLGVEVETFADVIIQSWMGQLAPGRELEIV